MIVFKQRKQVVHDLETNAITSLSLKNTVYGPSIFKRMCDALAKNTSLTSLDLEYNVLNDEKIQVLAEALKNHPTLSELNLTENAEITKSGLKILLETLKVKSLNLEKIFSEKMSFEDLEETLKGNHFITEIKGIKLTPAMQGFLRRNQSEEKEKIKNNRITKNVGF